MPRTVRAREADLSDVAPWAPSWAISLGASSHPTRPTASALFELARWRGERPNAPYREHSTAHPTLAAADGLPRTAHTDAMAGSARSPSPAVAGAPRRHDGLEGSAAVLSRCRRSAPAARRRG